MERWPLVTVNVGWGIAAGQVHEWLYYCPHTSEGYFVMHERCMCLYVSLCVWVRVCSFRLSPTDILPVTSPFSLRALRETFSNEWTRSEESWGEKKKGKKESDIVMLQCCVQISHDILYVSNPCKSTEAVCWTLGLLLWSRLKHLNKYWLCCTDRSQMMNSNHFLISISITLAASHLQFLSELCWQLQNECLAWYQTDISVTVANALFFFSLHHFLRSL